MKHSEIPRIVLMFLLVSGAVLISSGCKERDANVPTTDGQIDFIKVVEDQYRRLAAGKVRKKDGFSNQCSVDMKIDRGIRVSETVCDSGEKIWDITIRITDPASRPPSQRQKKINVALENGRYITLSHSISQQLSNGIGMNLDRTGQSVILNRKVNSKR